jgi:hypothetical protein
MMHHIDLSSVLRQTLSCDLYSNLVTRPTGAAVRGQIEQLLSDPTDASDARAFTIIDFSQVSMIDFSCADEVVAKLLMRYAADDAPRDAYFLFRGVNDDHWVAIEAVLERHGLALAVENAEGGGIRIAGVLSDDERNTWEAVYRLGTANADDVATQTGVDSTRVRGTLDSLCGRRLVMRANDEYVAVGCFPA